MHWDDDIDAYEDYSYAEKEVDHLDNVNEIIGGMLTIIAKLKLCSTAALNHAEHCSTELDTYYKEFVLGKVSHR